MLVIIILIVSSLLFYIYRSSTKSYKFFEQNGIPYLKPNSLFGNMTDAILLRKPLAIVYMEIYKKLTPHKVCGVLLLKKPTIMIRDPELIKHILIKDFAYFHDRGIKVNAELEPLRCHLFTLKGEEWKNLRIKLNTTFTSGKMKMMFPLVNECGKKLNKVIDFIPAEEPFDIKDVCARFTTDTIGTCAFGLDTGSLDDPNSEFIRMSKEIFKFRYQTILRSLWPDIPEKFIKMFNLTFIDNKVQNFFIDMIDKTVKYREESKVSRCDFLDLLIALRNNTMEENFHEISGTDELEKFIAHVNKDPIKNDLQMSTTLLTAQCFIFFAAGFETSSITLGYIMLELSQNEPIQNKVREEINKILEQTDGNPTYDSLEQMTYTDKVIAETLRKYPPAAFLFRECSNDYKIPGTETIIPAKTPVIIPVYGLHSDEKYFDHPDEFRPERFNEEEKAKRSNYTYLPFGEGPRICIAKRFAKMQIKIGLIYLLKNFSYRLSSKTKFPLEFEKNFVLLTVRNGIWLHREKI